MIPAFWKAFCDKTGTDSSSAYATEQWGNTPRMADELGELIRLGKKRGGAALCWEYEFELLSLPKVGDFTIVLNSNEVPLAVIRTCRVEQFAFKDVPAEFAAREGEGPGELAGTLNYWRAEHWRFFTEVCERIGRVPSEDMLVVCESFDVLHARESPPL
jgi:uncharacterized protein YhfF